MTGLSPVKVPSSLGIPLTTYGEILLGREGKSHTFAATKERRVMKKGIICVLVSLLFLSSCATYEGQGAVAGGSLGAILGSAIGGIAGGRHGRDVGTLIGAASGAMAGAAIGQQADKKERERYEAYQRSRQDAYSYDRYERGSYSDGRYERGSYSNRDESGYDPNNGGDDRISFDAQPSATVPLEIRHVRIIDADNDGILRAGEECRITFEVMNRSGHTLYDVQPVVTELTGNEHIHITPNLLIRSIEAKKGIRYTAFMKGDQKLKNGDAVVRVSVNQGNRELKELAQEFRIETRKR